MKALTRNPFVMVLSVIGIVGWIVVFVTAMIEIFANEPDSVITIGKYSLYIAFAATVILGLYAFVPTRRMS